MSVSDNGRDDDAEAIELSRVSASDGGEAHDDDKEEFELLRLRLLGSSGSGDDDDDRFRDDSSSYCRAACIDVRGWSMVSMVGIVTGTGGPLPASPPAQTSVKNYVLKKRGSRGVKVLCRRKERRISSREGQKIRKDDKSRSINGISGWISLSLWPRRFRRSLSVAQFKRHKVVFDCCGVLFCLIQIWSWSHGERQARQARIKLKIFDNKRCKESYRGYKQRIYGRRDGYGYGYGWSKSSNRHRQ